MQFIPQTDLTEDYKCPFIEGDVVFRLNVFGMKPFEKFQKLLTQKNLKKLTDAQYHGKLLSMGIKEVLIDGKVSKEKTLKLPPAALLNISDRIFTVNSVSQLGK